MASIKMHLDKKSCKVSVKKHWPYMHWYNFINAKNIFKMPNNCVCILEVKYKLLQNISFVQWPVCHKTWFHYS